MRETEGGRISLRQQEASRWQGPGGFRSCFLFYVWTPWRTSYGLGELGISPRKQSAKRERRRILLGSYLPWHAPCADVRRFTASLPLPSHAGRHPRVRLATPFSNSVPQNGVAGMSRWGWCSLRYLAGSDWRETNHKVAFLRRRGVASGVGCAQRLPLTSIAIHDQHVLKPTAATASHRAKVGMRRPLVNVRP